MKKIVLCLLSLFICMQSVALANIHQSKVSNVENIRSIYAYKDPEQMKDYEQKKLVKEQTKSDEKLEEPMALFRVFVNNDRFYTDDNKYKDNVELAITSHNIDRNYIFDNEYPPYLILQDNDNNRYEIHFAKVKYDNPYWISFNLTNKEIEQINKAKTISLVLPEAQENMYRYNKKKDKLEKKSYDNDSYGGGGKLKNDWWLYSFSWIVNHNYTKEEKYENETAVIHLHSNYFEGASGANEYIPSNNYMYLNSFKNQSLGITLTTTNNIQFDIDKDSGNSSEVNYLDVIGSKGNGTVRIVFDNTCYNPANLTYQNIKVRDYSGKYIVTIDGKNSETVDDSSEIVRPFISPR